MTLTARRGGRRVEVTPPLRSELRRARRNVLGCTRMFAAGRGRARLHEDVRGWTRTRARLHEDVRGLSRMSGRTRGVSGV